MWEKDFGGDVPFDITIIKNDVNVKMCKHSFAIWQAGFNEREKFILRYVTFSHRWYYKEY